MLRRNHQTKVLGFTWLTVIVAVGFGFELKCPEPSQWAFRKHMCGTPEKYSCLYDIDSKKYVESCFENTDFVKAGKRYVRWGGRNSYDCRDSRYQPRKFWSNVTSDCEMQKSNCCEEGQVAMSYGSTTEDSTCQCDLLNGFGFITTHADLCSCIPSQEDCNCYRIIFAEGAILTKEKDCVNMTNMLEAGEKCLSAVGSELKLPESTFLSGKSRTSHNLYRQGRIKLTALFLGIIFVACAVTGVAFGWEEQLDFKLMFLCNEEIREAMKDKDLYAKKVISNWKYLKSTMVYSDVMKELSAYRFINLDSLKKQQLFLEYTKDCILKFIVDRSYEIVDNIHWYDARKDILFQILQQPLVVTKCEQHIDKDKQRKHLYTYRKKLLKNVHIETDDIIDDFVQKSIFELSDMETIRSNSSEMNEQFFKTIINTLEKGSYRLWLDIAKNRGTCYSAIFNILNELEEDEIIRPSVEVTLVRAELHLGYADKVKEVSFDISIENNETQAIHSPSQENIPCASSFMQVLGLFPKVKTASTTGMKLDVICNNVLERIEHSMKKETFNDLVKKICNQHELETGTYVFNITCSVEKGDFNAHYPVTDMLPGTPLNIIQANRAFLVKELDVDIIAESLCNEIDEEYKRKIREEENREAKANIICDVFLQNKSPTLLKRLFNILKKENMVAAFTRLQKCQHIFSYSKGTDHLRNAIITNFDQIVSKLSQTPLIRVAFIQLLKERGILKTDIEDETEIGIVLVFVMKEGMNAMLHIVDVLHALELEDLADLIFCFQNTSYRCTAGEDRIKGKLFRKQFSNGILLKAAFKVMVKPNTVL